VKKLYGQKIGDKFCQSNFDKRSSDFGFSQQAHAPPPARPVAAPASVSERGRSTLFKNPLFSSFSSWGF
jgi:hypothetical protein